MSVCVKSLRRVYEYDTETNLYSFVGVFFDNGYIWYLIIEGKVKTCLSPTLMCVLW